MEQHYDKKIYTIIIHNNTFLASQKLQNLGIANWIRSYMH